MTGTEATVLDMRTEVSAPMIERIYHELLESSFGPDELDPLDSMLEGLTVGSSYEVWGLCVLDGETPIGCILGYPTEESGVLLIGYLVVRANQRSRGTGSMLIGEVQKRWFGRSGVTLVLAEVEDPRRFSVELGSDPKLRVKLYAKMGMQVIVGPYFQPKLEGDGRERVQNLFLTVLNETSDPASAPNSVSGKQVAKFLLEYFRSSGEGEDWPEDGDEEGKQLLAFYQDPINERVTLHPIGDYQNINIPPLN